MANDIRAPKISTEDIRSIYPIKKQLDGLFSRRVDETEEFMSRDSDNKMDEFISMGKQNRLKNLGESIAANAAIAFWTKNIFPSLVKGMELAKKH